MALPSVRSTAALVRLGSRAPIAASSKPANPPIRRRARTLPMAPKPSMATLLVKKCALPLFQLSLGEIQAHLAIAGWIVAPAVAHLDEEEEMDVAFQDVLELGAGFARDTLDGLPRLAQHDLLL